MRSLQLAIIVSIFILLALPNALQSYAFEECEGITKVGDRVGIKFQLNNDQGVLMHEPSFVIIHIKNSGDYTVQLSWMQVLLEPKEEMEVLQSWIPEATGQYMVDIFFWESLDNPVALSPVRTLTIDVSC